MHHIVRRAAILLAAPALTVSALAATSAPASAAPDPGPSEAAAAWMEEQLTDGVVHNEQYDFDDMGLTADFGFALAALGGHDDTVASIVDAIEPRAHDEWYTSTFDGVTTLYAGSLAKTAAFAQATGADPADFGGEDLVTMLEGTVSAASPTTGRVQDQNNDFGDTNTFGQSYAAQALAAAGSPSAASVTTFLLEQQCAEGFFRLDFAARDAADQTCDGDPASVPDTDATAIALMALVSVHNDALLPAIGKAEAWLLDAQRPSGAWGGGPTTEAPNANSTGIVGAVLAQLGDLPQARRAASWLRAHQLANVGACRPYAAADLGAVAYDDAARSALKTGIDLGTQDQVRRATAQALAVLPLARAAGKTHVLSSPEPVKGGTTTEVGVVGAAPGEALCAKLLRNDVGTLGWANKNGEAHLEVRLPNKTQKNRVRVSSAAGMLDTAVIKTVRRHR